MLPFANVTIIGLGLIGSSIAHAIRANMPGARITGYDQDPAVRARVVELGFCDDVTDSPGAAVVDVDLVMLCVPVGAIAATAEEIAADLPADAVVSDWLIKGKCPCCIGRCAARCPDHSGPPGSGYRA